MNAEAISLPVEQRIAHELPAATRGDRHAYGRIVAACQNSITAIALAITHDVPTSEDIAQQAFLSAWQHLIGATLGFVCGFGGLIYGLISSGRL